MIKLNEKTDKELFLAIMNFFVHNDINFMISRDLIYTTNVSNNIKISFGLIDEVVDSPCIAMSIEDTEEETSFYELDLRDSAVSILESIVNLIVNKVNRLRDNTLLSSDWKILLYKMIG